MTTRKRIKNELGKEFTKKLMAYAVTATGVMALTTGAEAGIVYSGPQNQNVSEDGFCNLNFDGGGTEFKFTQFSQYSEEIIAIRPNDSGDFWNGTAKFNHVSELALSYSIKSGLTNFVNSKTGGNSGWVAADTATGGPMLLAGKTGYIGVKFDCTAGTCYGWIQFTGAADVKSGTVVDWAYEDTGASIKAGDTGPVANNAPVADLNGSGTAGNDVSGSFTEGGGAVAIAPAGTVTDADGDEIQTVTVALTNNLDGAGTEALYLTSASNVTVAGSGTDTVTLTPAGTGTTNAQFTAALQAITYNNTSDTPDTTNRIITVVANDGPADSATSTVTMSVTAVAAPAVTTVAAPVATVMSVTSTATAAAGSHYVGSVITISIPFSYLVWVKGTPSLALNTGGPVPGKAYYSGGSGTQIITFEYTVAAGDDITGLDYWSRWALELNGGQIYSNEGIDADLNLPAPGESGSLGYNNTQGVLSTVYSVYRFYSPGLSKHLFTADENEKEYLLANAADVWQLETSPYTVFLPWQYDVAADEEKAGLIAVHRFYNATSQTHLYTADANEAAYLTAESADVWQSEGPVFYVPVGNPDGTIPVYRFYSEDLKVHLFTTDENEKTTLIDTAGDVWTFEGIAYYAYP
ncbi:hypothetical protein QUF75_11500 [Desulfococcaceae bacterium HSG7]|nr:hypothetical protein [Desulfococcaceae bacterium HSG7]